ncbi:PGR3 [Symbiodinium sp. CCMP2456]|nr:PGR3 [Symbiodinium sp. CCMP2456]
MDLEVLEAANVQLRGGKLWGLAGAISRLGKAGEWYAALQLLHSSDYLAKTKDKAYRPDTAAFNAGMKILDKLGRWRQVVATLEGMQHMLTRQSIVTMGSVVNSLVEAARNRVGEAWLRALAVVADVRHTTPGTGVVLMNTLLAASSADARWQISMQILQGAVWQSTETDIISWNSAMAASRNEWKTGLHCLAALRLQALVADVISLSSAAQCCAGELQWQQMLFFMGGPFQRSTPGINAGMTGLSRRSCWQQVLHAFGQLKSGLFGLRADSISVGVCIDALQTSKLWLRALDAGLSSEACGLQPDVATWNRMCTSSGSMSWHHAFVVLETLEGKLLKSDAATYSCLSSVCSNTHGWRESLSVLAKSSTMKHVANKVRLDDLLLPVVSLGACVKASNWEGALGLADCRLLKSQGQSGHLIAALVSLTEGHSKVSQWEASIQLLEQDAWQGGKPSLHVFSAAASSSLEPSSWRASLALLQSTQSLSLQKDTVCQNSVAASCGAAMQWLAAVSLSSELLQVGLQSSEVTHGVLLSICEDWRMALHCVQQVSRPQAGQLNLSSAVLGAAISTYSSGMRWMEAWSLLKDTDFAKRSFDRWYPSFEAVLLASSMAGHHETTRHQLTRIRTEFLCALRPAPRQRAPAQKGRTGGNRIRREV